MSGAIELPAHCAEFSTKSEQQRPAEIIAFLGRHVPSSMAGPLFKLLYDMAPCRTPRASMVGDKVKLLRGWRVNARSLQVLGPARSFPKTEARYSYRERMDDIVCGWRKEESVPGIARGTSGASDRWPERGHHSTSSPSFL